MEPNSKLENAKPENAEERGAASSPVPLTGEAQRRVRWSATTLAVLGTGSLLGVALSPYLLTHWPLVLIGLSPLGRHLMLAAPVVQPAAFLAVSVIRRLLFYFACFELGSALGPWAFPWIEARGPRLARFVRFMERIFARAPRMVVALMAGPTISALAGVSGMTRRVYLPLALGNLVVRMLLLLLLADWFRVYLETALAWIEAYWLPATALTLAGVLVYRLLRRGRIPSARDLDEPSAQ